jgi:hypothetical protein
LLAWPVLAVRCVGSRCPVAVEKKNWAFFTNLVSFSSHLSHFNSNQRCRSTCRREMGCCCSPWGWRRRETAGKEEERAATVGGREEGATARMIPSRTWRLEFREQTSRKREPRRFRSTAQVGSSWSMATAADGGRRRAAVVFVAGVGSRWRRRWGEKLGFS